MAFEVTHRNLEQLVNGFLGASAEAPSIENCSVPTKEFTATNNYKVVCRDLTSKTADDGLNERDFLKRLQSLIDTTRDLLQKKSESSVKIARLKQLEAQFKKHLSNTWTITEKLQELKQLHDTKKLSIEKYSEKRKKYLHTVSKEFKQYLVNSVLPELIFLVRQPGETYEETLQRLRQAEIDFQTQKLIENPRPILINEFTLDDSYARHAKALPADKITHYFALNQSASFYTAEQQAHLPDGHPNKDPEQSAYYKPCYARTGEGLAGVTQHAIGYKKEDNKAHVMRTLYSHTSLPAEAVEDTLKRMAINQRNAKQAIQCVASPFLYQQLQLQKTSVAALIENNSKNNPLPVSLTELRLLSPLSKKQEQAAQALDLLDHNAYRQIEETFISFCALDGEVFKAKVKLDDGSEKNMWVKANTSVMNFGANFARKEWMSFSDLQNQINTIGFNKLYKDIVDYVKELPTESYFLSEIKTKFKKFQEQLEQQPEYEELLSGREELKRQAQELQFIVGKAEELYGGEQPSTISDYRNKLAGIHQQLAKNHCLEMKLFSQWQRFIVETMPKDFAVSDRSKLKSQGADFINLMQDINTWHDLYLSGDYQKEQYNYCLQTILLRVNQTVGRAVASGCNDDKDRGKTFVNRVMADEIFYRENGHYPKIKVHDDYQKMQAIQEVAQKRTTSGYSNELSAPCGRGFQISEKDGNKHLNLDDAHFASLGKSIYKTPPLAQRLKAWVMSVKERMANNRTEAKPAKKRWSSALVFAFGFLLTATSSAGSISSGSDATDKIQNPYVVNTMRSTDGTQSSRSDEPGSSSPDVPIPVKPREQKDENGEDTKEPDQKTSLDKKDIRSSAGNNGFLDSHYKTLKETSKTTSSGSYKYRTLRDKYLSRGKFTRSDSQKSLFIGEEESPLLFAPKNKGPS